MRDDAELLRCHGPGQLDRTVEHLLGERIEETHALFARRAIRETGVAAFASHDSKLTKTIDM